MAVLLAVIIGLPIVWLTVEVVAWVSYGRYGGWWTPYRTFVWPRLHPVFALFGGYAVADVGKRQYVGSVHISNRELDHLLLDAGFQRNPWAALKRRVNREDVSKGSWVSRSSDKWYIPDFLAPMQLHVTVFERRDRRGYDVYAHWEDNYWVSPIAHVNGDNFSASIGVRKATRRLTANGLSVLDYDGPDPVGEKKYWLQ